MKTITKNNKTTYKMFVPIDDLIKEIVCSFPDAQKEINELTSNKLKTLAFLYCFLGDKAHPIKTNNNSSSTIAKELQKVLVERITTLEYNLN